MYVTYRGQVTQLLLSSKTMEPEEVTHVVKGLEEETCHFEVLSAVNRSFRNVGEIKTFVAS